MRRLVALGSILAALLVLAAFDPTVFEVAVSLALVALPAVNIAVAVLLKIASRRAPDVVSLRSRADDAVILSIASLIGAALGLNRLLLLHLPIDLVLGMLAFALVLISVPAVDWILTWRSVVREAVSAAVHRS